MSTSIVRFGTVYADNVVPSVLSTKKSTTTQSTSATSDVTLTQSSGIITLFTSTLASGAFSTFNVLDTNCVIGSVVLVSITGYDGNTGVPNIRSGNVGNGNFTVTLTNVHATAPLNGIVKIAILIV
jgi:hypothetical protein